MSGGACCGENFATGSADCVNNNKVYSKNLRKSHSASLERVGNPDIRTSMRLLV
jgi:hypothetical protein